MEDNNDEPVPMQIVVPDEPDTTESSDNDNSVNHDDNDTDTDNENVNLVNPPAIANAEQEHEEHEERVAYQSIANLLHAMRNPLRTAQRNIHSLGFLRGRSHRDVDDNDDTNSESIPDNAEKFDTDLPAEHSYLGSSMQRVSGVNYLESEKEYRLLIFMHHSMLFPGETLPMIIPDDRFDSSLLPDEGMLFGLVFPYFWEHTNPNLYGVTCQIYEKGNDQRNIVIKSRAHQRFVITKNNNPNFLDFFKPHESKIYANVRVLPEIVLPDPLTSIDLGSMNRFRNIASMSNMLRRLQASTTTWPEFIYNKYDITTIIEKAKLCLSKYKIDSMPNDLVLLSFWLTTNLLMDDKEKIKIFISNVVNIRMKIIEKVLEKEKYFCCRRCLTKIASSDSLFAMSKHGVQSNYCNPSGFIHETHTVYKVWNDSVYPTGAPSTEFSWFPGYSWQIVLCRFCDTHIGWKFVSTKSNFVPKKFYGLSGANITVKKDTNNSESQSQQNRQNFGGPLDDENLEIQNMSANGQEFLAFRAYLDGHLHFN